MQVVQQDRKQVFIKAPRFVSFNLPALTWMSRLSAAAALHRQQCHLPDSSPDDVVSILKQYTNIHLHINNTIRVCPQLQCLLQYASRAWDLKGDIGLSVPGPDYVALPNGLNHLDSTLAFAIKCEALLYDAFADLITARHEGLVHGRRSKRVEHNLNFLRDLYSFSFDPRSRIPPPIQPCLSTPPSRSSSTGKWHPTAMIIAVCTRR